MEDYLNRIFKTLWSIISLPFSWIVMRLRNRRDIYRDFWIWADNEAEEIKLGAYAQGRYVIPRIVESGFHINHAYDALRKLERQYVHRLPQGLRRKIRRFFNAFWPVVKKYGDPHDQMYGAREKRLPPNIASEAASKIQPSIVSFRDYCRKKLDSILYRSLG